MALVLPATDTAPSVSTLSPPKLAYIDALRGIAILAVIMIHTEFMGPDGTRNMPLVVSAFIAAGVRGVHLFFVASAFTMFYSLSRRPAGEKNPTLNFFLRRFFRIAPCYWLGIVGYSLCHYYLHHQTFTPANYVAEFLFLHGLSPYWINNLQPGGWSITVEMCFYLLVPFLFQRLVSLNHAVAFLLLTVVVNIVLQAALYHWPLMDVSTHTGWFLWSTFRFAFLPSQMPVFAFGFLLFFLSQPGPKQVHPMLLLLAAGILVAVFALSPNESLELNTNGMALRLLPPHVISGGAFVLLALALQRQPYRLLVNPVTRYLGTLSFSLYLCHFLIAFLMIHFGWWNVVEPSSTLLALLNYALRFLFICMASVPLAYALHHMVELPGQRLGRAVVARLENRS